MGGPFVGSSEGRVPRPTPLSHPSESRLETELPPKSTRPNTVRRINDVGYNLHLLDTDTSRLQRTHYVTNEPHVTSVDHVAGRNRVTSLTKARPSEQDEDHETDNDDYDVDSFDIDSDGGGDRGVYSSRFTRSPPAVSSTTSPSRFHFYSDDENDLGSSQPIGSSRGAADVTRNLIGYGQPANGGADYYDEDDDLEYANPPYRVDLDHRPSMQFRGDVVGNVYPPGGNKGYGVIRETTGSQIWGTSYVGGAAWVGLEGGRGDGSFSGLMLGRKERGTLAMFHICCIWCFLSFSL